MKIRTFLKIAERDKINMWLRNNIDFCRNHTLGEITNVVNGYTQLTAKPSQVVSSLKALEIKYSTYHTKTKPVVSTTETPDYIKDMTKMLLYLSGQLSKEEESNMFFRIRTLAGLNP